MYPWRVGIGVQLKVPRGIPLLCTRPGKDVLTCTFICLRSVHASLIVLLCVFIICSCVCCFSAACLIQDGQVTRFEHRRDVRAGMSIGADAEVLAGVGADAVDG